MPSSQARVPTASASRYLQQVCKHWSHKFAVEFTSEKGHIPFNDGRICNLEATPDVLTLRAEAPDAEALLRPLRLIARSPYGGQGSAVMAAASAPTSSLIVDWPSRRSVFDSSDLIVATIRSPWNTSAL